VVGEVLAVMRQLATEGMTMLIVSHEMGFAASTAMFMDDGRIVEEGLPAHLFATPQRSGCKRFLRRTARSICRGRTRAPGSTAPYRFLATCWSPTGAGRFTLVEDTSPGVHDTLIAACDLFRYITLGVDEYHDNCSDNLRMAMMAIGLTVPEVPQPFNIWMNIPLAADCDARR
jgi:Domain of unknown function (DUF1989)